MSTSEISSPRWYEFSAALKNFSKRSSTPGDRAVPSRRWTDRIPRRRARRAASPSGAARLDQSSLRREIALATTDSVPCGPRAAASSGDMWRRLENNSPRVLSNPHSPQRGDGACSMTMTCNAARPRSLHAHRIYPGQRVESRAGPRQVHIQEAEPRTRSLTTRSIIGATRWNGPESTTDSIGWSSSHVAPAISAESQRCRTRQRAPVDRATQRCSLLRRFLCRPNIALSSGPAAREAGLEDAPDQFVEVDPGAAAAIGTRLCSSCRGSC